MNDTEMLGLNAGFTPEELKAAYRKKAKLLHPDKNKDTLASHIEMIRLNQAYSNLLKQASETDKKPEQKGEDLSYRYYKAGVDIFQSIHPSEWKKNPRKDFFNAHAVETDENVLKILADLIERMSKAYYFFSITVSEYADSCWASDAKSKLQEIEKMTSRYARILKSYQEEINRKN